MNPEEVSARAAHPAGTARIRQIHLDDQFDAHAEEALKLTRDAQRTDRMPRPAHPGYDIVAAALAGALFGVLLFIWLLTQEGVL